MLDLDTANLVQRYLAGESLQALGKMLGVCSHTIKAHLKAAGVRLRNKAEAISMVRRCNLDVSAILERYRTGETEQRIAQSLNVARTVIRRRLLENGITPRTYRQAHLLRMAKMTEKERLCFTQAAHAAVRGQPQSEEHRCKIAQSIERKGLIVSPNERTLASWLRALGLTCQPLKAIGRYNVDIALTEYSVAVEIFGGTWHSVGRHAERYRPRIKYLLDRDWTPVIIWIIKSHLLRYRVAENIVSLCQILSTEKTLRRQEHVFRGDGYIPTPDQINPDNGSIVIGFNPGNPNRGQNGRFR